MTELEVVLTLFVALLIFFLVVNELRQIRAAHHYLDFLQQLKEELEDEG